MAREDAAVHAMEAATATEAAAVTDAAATEMAVAWRQTMRVAVAANDENSSKHFRLEGRILTRSRRRPGGCCYGGLNGRW